MSPSSGAAQNVAQGAAWKLSPDPVLRIGEDQTSATEFLRITGMTRTATGNIIIANSGTNELRVFSSAGKFVKSFGRRGAGPGEFQSMRWVGKNGDSVYLHDSQSMRISTFTVNGGFVTSKLIPSVMRGARIYPMARFSNGDFLLQPIRARSQSTQRADGVFRDSTPAGILLDAHPDSATWIGPFPFMSWLAYNPVGLGTQPAVDLYEFGPKSRWVVWGNLLWIGDEASNELMLVDKAGKIVNRVQLPWAPRPYDKLVFERAAKSALAQLSAEERNRFTQAEYSTKYLPRFEPSFKQFLVAPEGQLWVERFHFDPATPGECVVMTRAGTVVAHLTIPGNFEPQEIGSDYVLGVARDGDGVETVAMYRIWK
ncbi:MAG: 6-bladed beta-propeller [Gemmatimonas sp.]